MMHISKPLVCALLIACASTTSYATTYSPGSSFKASTAGSTFKMFSLLDAFFGRGGYGVY